MSVDLSIIIVSWNTCDLLAACLQSIVQGAGEPLSLEQFVIDNASCDASASMVRQRFPQVHLVENQTNIGFAAANNQGLALAQGRYVLLLNSDTVVNPGALAELVAFMDAHPQTGACGPLVFNADGTLQVSCYPFLTPWREFARLVFLDSLLACASYPMARWDRGVPCPVQVISGCAMLLRRAALDQVGVLDERYFMYSEEMDLCYRLAGAGWQAYWVPQAQIVHYGGASASQAAQAMYIQLYRSKLQFHRKVGGPARARLFKALLAAAYAPRLLAATIARLWSPRWVARAHTYRCLLAELPGM